MNELDNAVLGLEEQVAYIKWLIAHPEEYMSKRDFKLQSFLSGSRVFSSAGLEHYLDRVGVTGSNPVIPTEEFGDCRERHWFESSTSHQ